MDYQRLEMENAGRIPLNSYDRVPYLGISHSLTHPDNLATIGTLLHLSPTNIQNCRVLELGCANGSNLIPMASGLPGSEFFGLDFSGVQIAQGQEAIKTLGLRNINLKHMNILDVEASLGQFDYIITHGIFSWVAEEIRDKILSICDRNLTSEGIAYISYNTYPGWYSKKILRDLMLYHTRKINEPQIKIDRARNFLDYMVTSVESVVKQSKSQAGENYVGILKREKERLATHSDTYLFHEELEETNYPLYFYQFAELAGRHGLQYLSEANMSEVFMNDIPSEIKQSLVGVAGDIIELEQYLDFLMNRHFRSTLLVHQDLKISRRINVDRISTLFVGSNCLPVSSNPDILTRAVEQFVCPSGIKMATDHPVTKAAMLYLGEIWPHVVPIDKLLEMAYAHLRKVSPSREVPIPENSELRNEDMQVLRANLLKGFISSPLLVEFHVHAPRFTTLLSDLPISSPFARLQAISEVNSLKSQKSEKLEPFTVTNLRHERIELEGLSPYILYHLDGNCSRDELLARLFKLFEDGLLDIGSLIENKNDANKEGKEQVKVEQVKQALVKNMDAELQWLARAALLIA